MLSTWLKTDVDRVIILSSPPSALGTTLRNLIAGPLDKTRLIVNIKTLRNWAADNKARLTLQDGKWALENWHEFLEFVDEFNRLPIAGFATKDGPVILR